MSETIMSETINDILKEMKQSADDMERHHLYDLREWGTDNLRVLADRIEAANSRSYDKYKEDTNELNRQILVLKHEKEMSDTHFCGYDPEEDLVAQCSTCRFFKKKFSHCTLNDSLTNARYKCSGWEFKTNKECADEYKKSINNEVAELRKENAHLRDALKPVLECKVMSAITAEIAPGRSKYCATIIEEAQHIYNELRIAKKKEEDIEYEYAIQQKLECEWVIIASGFWKIEDVRHLFNSLNEKAKGDEMRIVSRPILNWEEVK